MQKDNWHSVLLYVDPIEYPIVQKVCRSSYKAAQDCAWNIVKRQGLLKTILGNRICQQCQIHYRNIQPKTKQKFNLKPGIIHKCNICNVSVCFSPDAPCQNGRSSIKCKKCKKVTCGHDKYDYTKIIPCYVYCDICGYGHCRKCLAEGCAVCAID